MVASPRKLFTRVALTVGIVALLIPASPASADPVVFAATGTVHYSGPVANAPSVDNGCLAGTMSGTHNGLIDAYFSYTGNVVMGTANGSMNLPGASHDSGFTWVRVGSMAVVTLSNASHAGIAVAAFAGVPDSSLLNQVQCRPAHSWIGGAHEHFVMQGLLLPL